MQKIKYPLILSDFDGTLVRSDGTVSDFSKETIREYIQNGGIFAISTGRMPAGILPRVKELGLSGFACCAQGSIIIDVESNEVILQGTISNDVAVQVCEKMEEMGLHIHVYDLWEYYSNMDDDALKMYEGIVKTKAKLVLDKPISQYVKETGLQPCKILAMLDPIDNERVRIELDKQNFAGCSVTRSSVFLVEVGNATYSKGTSLEFLSNKYNVAMENTIAIGDQVNDLSMIEKAGLGLAVQNADEALQAKAIVLPDTHNEDAVAKAILQYAYEKI